MTMPVERTRALRQAGELLRALNRRPDIPEDIRRWAQGVLRHYPEEWQLRLIAQEWQLQRHSMLSLAAALMPEPDQPQNTNSD